MPIAIAADLDAPSRELCLDGLSGASVRTSAAPAGERVWDDAYAECEIVFGTVPPSWIPRLTELRWLQLESTGHEYYHGIAEHFAQRGVIVTNLRAQFAHPAAETAVAGMLSLTRGLDALARARQTRAWRTQEIRPRTTLLARSTAIVLGAGAIGLHVRRLLEGFGVRVQSFARTSPVAELQDTEALDAALADADIVIGCLPSTPETRLLFDRTRLARLARSAILVNVGRGDLLDEEALADALDSRDIAGCVLDVTAEEPLSPRSRLWSTPNTVLTQHTGGGHRDELADKVRYFLSNLERWRAGEPLDGVVDWNRGY